MRHGIQLKEIFIPPVIRILVKIFNRLGLDHEVFRHHGSRSFRTFYRPSNPYPAREVRHRVSLKTVQLKLQNILLTGTYSFHGFRTHLFTRAFQLVKSRFLFNQKRRPFYRLFITFFCISFQTAQINHAPFPCIQMSQECRTTSLATILL